MLGALFEKGQTMSDGWPLEVMATGVVGHVLGFFALTVAATCLIMAAVFLLYAGAFVMAYIIQELTGGTDDDGW
jgi:hypothetical protein